MGIQIGVATMEDSMDAPQKIKNKTTIWSSNPTSEYISKEYENRILKKCLNSHVHYGLAHNSQDMEIAHVFVNQQMNNVAYIDSGILCSHWQQHGLTLRALDRERQISDVIT